MVDYQGSILGELYLTIGAHTNTSQVKGWYTRLMRDEVLAEWEAGTPATLHIHCHVSGGLVLGSAGWRYSIFKQHLPMVLQAFRFADRLLLSAYPELCQAQVLVHFHARQKKYNTIEKWGKFC